MRYTLNLKASLCLILFTLPAVAFGDTFRQGMFQLSQASLPNHYQFIAQYPAQSDSTQPILWPNDCVSLDNKQYQLHEVITQTHLITCTSALTNGDKITLPYDLDAAIVDLQIGAWEFTSVVPGSRAGITVVLELEAKSPRPLATIAQQYLFQGIVHIWFGWDHLAFVFCLCLLAVGLRHLLWVITAFTLGHSLSMGLSFFKFISVPISPIEAIIAVSIVIMAREAWYQIDTTYPSAPINNQRGMILVVVMLFGLIHGLGFASALDNLGVYVNEQMWALIFFNLGVEAGQIVFVLALTGLLIALRHINQALNFCKIALVGVGSVGVFWTIERISGFTQ